jgi:PAS domain S-box-containing protein
MKIYYADSKDFNATVKKIKKSSYRSLLIQIYSGITDKDEITSLVKKLKKNFPDAVIIGSSTAGEVAHGKLYEQSVQISFTLFEKTKLKAHYVKKTDSSSAKKIAKKIKSKDMKAAIILSEGLNGDHLGFLETINSLYPKLIIAGGLAGDNFKLKQTYLIFDDKIYESGSLMVSFSSKSLYANNSYNLSWMPIGKEMYITKAKGSRVYEIDGIPASKVFKHYLGKQIFKKPPQSLLEFQLLFSEGNTTVARTPMARDGDSLIFAAPVKNGQKVQFGFSNAESILSQADIISSSLAKKPAEAIYLFSCIARKSLLGDKLHDELQKFEDIAPTHGFITYGEYYKTDESNALLNCTTTLLILSENTKSKSLHVKSTKENFKLGENTFNSLLHFIKQTTTELNTKIAVLDQYKKAVDSALLVSKTDTKGIITYVNDNFCKVSGYSKEELIGQNHNIIRHKSVKKSVFKILWETISSGKIWHGKIKNSSKNGEDYIVDATISPIFNEKGEIKEYIALRQDITQQVKVQNDLKLKEKEQRMIFDNQDSIVIFASKNGGIQVINRRFFELFDYKDIDDFKAKHTCICDLFIEEEGYIYPSERENWLEFVANTPDHRHKVKMRDKFDKIRTFLLKVNIFDNKFVVNISDITPLEEALLKANLSEHAKSMFLANMSHEIRTPLNGILGFTDVLMKRDLSKQDKDYLQIIHKSGETLLAIVDDILDISKIESGQMELSEVASNLSLDLESVVAVFATKAKEKNIHYKVFINPNIPKLLVCDSQRIKQIMSNLISNAIKFTPEKGEINVQVTIKKHHKDTIELHFEVRDSGIGIEKKNIAKVFQAFSQADSSTSREYGGTGLGLPISAKFVEMMHSQLKVESKINFGTTFYFDVSFKIKDNDAFLHHPSNSIKIALLKQEPNHCDETVQSYLKAWNHAYDIIEDITKLNDNFNILIISSSYLKNEDVTHILQKHPNLHIICVDITSSKLDITDRRIEYLIQPITGSILYDAIVSNFSSELESVSSDDEDEIKIDAHILVAEDNAVNQLLISTLLENRDISYDIANNGQELLDMYVSSSDVDLILMDVNMPVLDGVEATKHLRNAGYTLPIIALTANVMAKDKEIYSQAGMDAYISKPIVPKELDKVLLEFLPEKEKTDMKEEVIEFDVVSYELLGEGLGLKNTTILERLIIQFKESSLSFIDNLSDNTDIEDLKDHIHQIKGVVGNLRFNNSYKLSQELEKKLQNSSSVTEDIQRDISKLISHLKHLQKECGLLIDKK